VFAQLVHASALVDSFAFLVRFSVARYIYYGSMSSGNVSVSAGVRGSPVYGTTAFSGGLFEISTFLDMRLAGNNVQLISELLH
jgi:hypothetical protein